MILHVMPAKLQGHVMHCHHERDQLVWELFLSLPWQPEYTYKYAVVTTEGSEAKVRPRLLLQVLSGLQGAVSRCPAQRIMCETRLQMRGDCIEVDSTVCLPRVSTGGEVGGRLL